MVAIGALGGSGTRVIAEILIKAGVYMGDDLNEPNDNLIFTRLFKNPAWYKTSTLSEKQERIALFFNYMQIRRLTLENLFEIYKAAFHNFTFRSDLDFYLKTDQKLFAKQINIEHWGWKEPNNQIYMSELLDFCSKLKYIHILRHGLEYGLFRQQTSAA